MNKRLFNSKNFDAVFGLHAIPAPETDGIYGQDVELVRRSLGEHGPLATDEEVHAHAAYLMTGGAVSYAELPQELQV